jgi:hypothetical protein
LCAVPLIECLLSGCDSRSDREHILVLTEESSIHLPDSLTVRSASFADDGSILVLHRDGRAFVVTDDSNGGASIRSCGREQWIAARLDGDTVEGFTHASKGPFRRRCVASNATKLSLAPEADYVSDATWNGEQWAWVRRDERGGAIVLRQRLSSNPTALDTVFQTSDLVAGQDVFVRPLTNGFAVGEFRTPFTIRVLSSGRTQRTLLPPQRLRDSLESASRDDPKRWVALTTLGLDSGYLQYLADLNSDHRLLQLYDSEGRPTRRISIDAPLGLLASDPVKKRVLGYRRINGPELMLYRWEWQFRNGISSHARTGT